MRGFHSAKRSVTAWSVAAWSVAAVLLHPTSAQGGFLPTPDKLPININKIEPNAATDKILQAYVGDIIPFQRDVFCPGTKTYIGQLNFDFAGWTGTREVTIDGKLVVVDVGGAIIRGGFILGPDSQIVDGFGLRWLQTVKITPPGSLHVDPDKTGKPPGPFYPLFPTKGVNVPLFDPPNVFQTETLTFNFESAVVCVDIKNPNNVQYLGSFQWGYRINKDKVTPEAPHDWMEKPTDNWFAAIKNDFPDLKVTQGCCIVVPGPPTWLLMLLGGLTAGGVRRTWRPQRAGDGQAAAGVSSHALGSKAER